jgi:hypothetical protein
MHSLFGDAKTHGTAGRKTEDLSRFRHNPFDIGLHASQRKTFGNRPPAGLSLPRPSADRIASGEPSSNQE